MRRLRLHSKSYFIPQYSIAASLRQVGVSKAKKNGPEVYYAPFKMTSYFFYVKLLLERFTQAKKIRFRQADI